MNRVVAQYMRKVNTYVGFCDFNDNPSVAAVTESAMDMVVMKLEECGFTRVHMVVGETKEIAMELYLGQLERVTVCPT